MTHIGKSVFLVYSIAIIIVLMARSIVSLKKGTGQGWESALLLPVLILLANLI